MNAFEAIKKGKNVKFDPDVVGACLKLYEEDRFPLSDEVSSQAPANFSLQEDNQSANYYSGFQNNFPLSTIVPTINFRIWILEFRFVESRSSIYS